MTRAAPTIAAPIRARVLSGEVAATTTAIKTIQASTYTNPAKAARQAERIVSVRATLLARQTMARTARAIVKGKGTILAD